MSTTLRQQAKERLKVAFDQVRSISNCLTFILVVDEFALRVISNTIKMMELINYGITSVQRLDLKRKKFHKIEAVYLIHPISYEAVLDDYSLEGSPQYNVVHILSLTKIPHPMMKGISQCKELVSRLKTLKEINMNYLLHSSDQFKVGALENISFSDTIHEKSFDHTVNNAVDELTTVLTSMSSFYIVEILYSKSNVSTLTEKIALGLKERLQNMFKIYERNQSHNYTHDAPQTTFLILDRSFDAVSPLVRDFHYMPLLYEYKQVKDHKTETGKKGQKNHKIFNFDNTDEIFTKYRNAHLAITTEGISKDFQAFSHSHVAAKFQKNKNSENESMNNMAEVLKKIPQYNELKDKYSFHIDMANDIFSRFKQKNQKELGQLEQTIISLMNQQRKKVKPSDLINDIINKLPQLDNQEKARLLAISLMCLQLKPKDKSILIEQCSKIPNFDNLNKKISLLVGSNLYTLNSRKGQDKLILDRHLPKIQEIVRELSNGNQSDLKFLRVGSDSRSTKTNFKGTGTIGRKKIGVQMDKVTKPRLILFVTSALGYNQLRCLGNLDCNYHIIYGSHNFVTPQQYLELINEL